MIYLDVLFLTGKEPVADLGLLETQEIKKKLVLRKALPSLCSCFEF